MKRFSLTISSLCCALALLLCGAATVFAEETKNELNDEGGSLLINGEAEVRVGDVVTYSLYMSDAVEPIVGFELRLFYDSDCLEYQRSSLKFEKFDVVIYSEEIEGKIPMNCTSLTNTPSFEKKGQFVSASFKVKQGGEAGITYFFTDLYGENLDYLRRYTFTYDLNVDDKAVIKDATPPVNNDAATLENNQGDFINYVNGKGEENSPEQGADHARVGSAVVTKIVEVTRASDADTSQGGGFFGSVWFMVIAGLAVLAAVITAVVIVIVRRRKDDFIPFD